MYIYTCMDIFTHAKPTRTHWCIHIVEYRALLIEYRALLIEYRALLIECRALLREYRAFVIGCRALLVVYRAFMIKHSVRVCVCVYIYIYGYIHTRKTYLNSMVCAYCRIQGSFH